MESMLFYLETSMDFMANLCTKLFGSLTIYHIASIVVTTFLITIVIYKCVIKPMKYWDKLGVPHPSWFNYVTLNWFAFFIKQSTVQLAYKMYDAVRDVRYHGLHQFNVPCLVIKDPELIKQIAIKDFDHFTDRRFTFADNSEPLFGKNLLNLKGQRWRSMRAYLSPSFTTNKMKILFQIIDKCSKKFIEYFDPDSEEVQEFEMQDIFTRFTNDVIASCVFGIEVDSLREPDNEFYMRGRQATDLTKPTANFKVVCAMLLPKLYKFLRLNLLASDTVQFFTKLINDSINLREEGKIVQVDMMHILLEAKKEYESQQKLDENAKTKASLTTEDIISQAFIFFFAGFESVARTMCFMAHELAVNPDIQDRLRAEIKEVDEVCKGQITYDSLVGMKYMDMVTSEVLRKYPIQVATDRLCTKPYVLQPTKEGEQPLSISTGTIIIFPTYPIHRNPEYYTDPDKFDPERFNDENKADINPYIYHPFGLGPRMCIGLRFALMETKLIFYYILNKFEIVPVEKTQIPLSYVKSLMTLSSEHGFWLGMKKL